MTRGNLSVVQWLFPAVEGKVSAPLAAPARATQAAERVQQSVSRDDDLVAALGGDLVRLQRLARGLVPGAADADDLVAEAIARTLPAWRSGRVDDAGAYVRRVMVNLVRSRFRRRLVGARRDHVARDWSASPADSAERIVERDRTMRAIRSLPVRRRVVVLLRFYEDLPLDRIAAVLGISEGTVKSQLSRALEQLRVQLGDQERS